MGYDATALRKRIKITYRQLQYWHTTGLVIPSEQEKPYRIYTFQDLVLAKAAQQLLEFGVSLQKTRPIIRRLRDLLQKIAEPLETYRLLINRRHAIACRGPIYGDLSDYVLVDCQALVKEHEESGDDPENRSDSIEGSDPASSKEPEPQLAYPLQAAETELPRLGQS